MFLLSKSYMMNEYSHFTIEFVIDNNSVHISIKRSSLYKLRHSIEYIYIYLKKICITHNGPFLWNLLENRFKLLYNINTFTRSLKYNYISMY